MILVTLGTQDKSFSRLLKLIEDEIKNNNIKEEVIVQAGNTKYSSKYMKIFDFIPISEFDKTIKDCNLLITHGGVGSIITGLRNNKKVIAAPRLSKYKEHTNDHQLQIIERFSKEGYILPFYEKDNLKEILKKSKDFVPKKYEANGKIIKIITDFIN